MMVRCFILVLAVISLGCSDNQSGVRAEKLKQVQRDLRALHLLITTFAESRPTGAVPEFDSKTVPHWAVDHNVLKKIGLRDDDFEVEISEALSRTWTYNVSQSLIGRDLASLQADDILIEVAQPDCKYAGISVAGKLVYRVPRR